MVSYMGNHFQWHTDTEIEPPPGSSTQRRSWEMMGFWLTTAVLLMLLVGGWLLSQRRLAQMDEMLRAELQTLLDWQHAAFLAGDGDLFFTLFAADPAWQAAQLLPFNQSAHRSGFTVAQLKTNQEQVWVNAVWTEENETYHRLLFFEKRNGRYRQTAADPAYWQKPERRPTTWGELETYPVDDEWAADFDAFVTAFCSAACPPLTLVVGNDYAETAVPHTIRIPSPRLVALDQAGQPSDAYWDLLEQRLAAHVRPAVIRIALPPQNFLNLNHFDFDAAAAQFMAENPDIRVELVTLDRIPTGVRQLAGYDGAAFPPTAAMIAAGAVYDLTPLLETDVDFDQGDFYEQIWQGAWWRGRMWFMPQAAAMRLLFYNKTFYRQAELAEPSFHWTWAELEADLRALREVVTAVDSSLRYTVFLDTGQDSLLAYAYNWQTVCAESAAVRCQTDLTPERARAALSWRRRLTEAPALTPMLSPGRQTRWNWQAAVRVEEPVYYEHFLQMSALGVAPFPGSSRFAGTTPLWLDGSFITQHSAQPLAVWRWLKFLSYQPPLARYRLIPARPSTAAQTAYWQTLPRPLNEAMRAAFPYSRPVKIGDELWFEGEGRTAVATPQSPSTIPWFFQK
jgi:ABC-type glycerol-3-phosphate transport system substrate-binding protein